VRPIQATISAPALRANYAAAQRAARGARVYAVVKANGYGHGLERVTRALARAQGFGTVELDGAVATRERGFAQPILLLEGFFEASELPVIAANDLQVVVHSQEQLRTLETAKPGAPLDVFFKINTGMNRLGFPVAQARAMLERLRASGAARSITLMTHFATADGPPGSRRRCGASTKRHAASRCRKALPTPLPSSAIRIPTPTSSASASRSTAPRLTPSAPRSRWGWCPP
jgi:alanine racemase